MDASHGMYAPMTPAQGKFLTTLLDKATAKDADAGAKARVATRALYAEGRLTKTAASAWIDVLKRFVDTPHGTLGQGPQPVGTPSRTPLRDSVVAACAKVGVTPGAPRRTGSGVPTHGPNRTMAMIAASVGRPQEVATDCPF
jgi:hypothetical protein